MFIWFEVIHERDRQTDKRTPDDSIGRTYASHRATKISETVHHGLGAKHR